MGHGRAYYNEHDPFAAQWLRNLIAAGHIAPGEVDERDIREVRPDDLRGYTQHHFFAGIGLWSVALRLAGWDDARPVWTGSCPCQPFSAAGKRKGAADERHLWPYWLRLIESCRPAVIFGEQVASPDAIGRSVAKGQDVQGVLDREAVFGVLRELQGRARLSLQELPVLGRADQKAQDPGSDEGSSQEVAGRLPRACAGERGAPPCQNAQFALRLGPSGYPTTDRCGSLRANGHSIRSVETEGMERALSGSDPAGSGVHDDEYSRCSLRPECDGEYVGPQQNSGDCFCDHESQAGRLEHLVSQDRRELEATANAWFAIVRSDLGRNRYVVGACNTPAAGVGAPHIRQRLFWVAHSQRGTPERHGHEVDGAAREAESAAHQRQRLRPDAGDGEFAGGLAHSDGRHPRDRDLQRSGEYGLEPKNGGAGRLADDPRDGRRQGRSDPGRRGEGKGASEERRGPAEFRDPRRLGDTSGAGLQIRPLADDGSGTLRQQGPAFAAHGPENGWASAAWLPCTDGKFRPVPQSVFRWLADDGAAGVGLDGLPAEAGHPLAKSFKGRPGALRGFGNAKSRNSPPSSSAHGST